MKAHGVVLGVVVMVVSAASGWAGTGLSIGPGEIGYHEKSAAFTERLKVPAAVVDALQEAPVGTRLVIDSFPVEPGRRASVELRRVEIYAPGARLMVVDSAGEREVERPQLRYFRGRFQGSEAGVAVSLDPATGVLRGTVISAAGTWVMERDAGKAAHQYQLARSRSLWPADAEAPSWQCGNDSLGEAGGDLSAPLNPGVPGPAAKRLATVEYQAVIALDTDNEFLYYKFSNDTGAASTWIASLFNSMNVIYERDLSLTLLQGDTFLRLDLDASPTFNDDPWDDGFCYNPGTGQSAGSCQSSANCSTGWECRFSPANGSQLSEFAAYWSANNGAVDRVFAMLLSGKSSSSFSSSGIAWVDAYCSTSYGYAVTQVFKYTGFPIADETMVPAHELGHNFGSPHTHCYNPPIDQCYAGQCGSGTCYCGAVSCPAGGSGTLMSYCHFPAASGGANCGDNLLEMHTTVETYVDSRRAVYTPGCVEYATVIFDDGFESGELLAWAVSAP